MDFHPRTGLTVKNVLWVMSFCLGDLLICSNWQSLIQPGGHQSANDSCSWGHLKVSFLRVSFLHFVGWWGWWQAVLRKPGLSLGKVGVQNSTMAVPPSKFAPQVSILCGGPDWPYTQSSILQLCQRFEPWLTDQLKHWSSKWSHQLCTSTRPTSVLAGILGLSLLECEIGTMQES